MPLMHRSENHPKVSIIVAAYNAAEYLEECLGSLCGQTCEDLEVIVVDDGSSDGTSEICRRWAAHDLRVRVLTQGNSGVSVARNKGLDSVRGSYVCFVDADDIVAPDFVETLLSLMESPDGVACAAVGRLAFSREAPSFRDGFVSLYEGDDAVLSILGSVRGFVADKMYRARVIREGGIRFREDVAQSEDMLFNLDYLSLAPCLAFNSGGRYGYRQHQSSATNRLSSLRWFDCVTVFEEFEGRFKDDREALLRVWRSFLPVAYEARWRYRRAGLDNDVLRGRISRMVKRCGGGLLGASLAFRAKMLVYRFVFGLAARRRARLAS